MYKCWCHPKRAQGEVTEMTFTTQQQHPLLAEMSSKNRDNGTSFNKASQEVAEVLFNPYLLQLLKKERKKLNENTYITVLS